MPRHPSNQVTEPVTGFWWCRVCQGAADLEDAGEPFPRCIRCGQHRALWTTTAAVVAPGAQSPAAAAAPEEARPAEPVKRLAAERRPGLMQMLTEGYHFCLACETVTEPGADEACVLCGSSQVEWRGPAVEGGER